MRDSCDPGYPFGLEHGDVASSHLSPNTLEEQYAEWAYWQLPNDSDRQDGQLGQSEKLT